MAKIGLLRTTNTTQAAALTRYLFMASGWHAAAASSETSAIERTHKLAGTIGDLWLRVTQNSVNGTSTFRTRKNRANGALSVSIDASTTGEWTDTSATDSVAVDDETNFQLVTGGSTGTMLPRNASVTFAASADTTTCLVLYTSRTMSRNTTVYEPIEGGYNSPTGTESQAIVKVFSAGTAKNLQLYLNSNTINATSSFTLRDDTSDTALAISIPAATSGLLTDYTNSVSVAANSFLAFKLVTGTGSGSQSLQHGWSCFDWVTTNKTQLHTASRTADSQSNNITVYYPLSGDLTQASTDESIHRVQLGYPFLAKSLWIMLSNNTCTGSTTMDLRKNGASTALSCSIGAGTTGLFEDTDTGVSFTATDEANTRMVPGTGSIATRVVSVGVTNDEVTIAARVTAVQAELTYTAAQARVTAAQATLTYTAAQARVTAAQATLTYDAKAARVTAAQAELTYTAAQARVTAAQAEYTYTAAQARVTAAQATLTYDSKAARVTAAQAELTYTAAQARVTAAQAEYTYSAALGRVTAAQAELTYTAAQARVTAAQAEYTYSAARARVTAAQVELTYSTLAARVTALQATLTYTETAPTVAARVTALQATLTYTAAAARVTAVQAQYTYSAAQARVTAAQLQLEYSAVQARVTAAQATLDYTAAQARVTAVQATYTYDPVAARVVACQVALVWEPLGARVTALQVALTYTSRPPSNRQVLPDVGARVSPWQAIRPMLLWRKR